ncbi:MAG: protein kinase domain-containing protein [Phototrophicaceae bacterium]
MSEQFLGKYQLLERIGKGGMAEVFRGYHQRLDRYVAIKVLHPFLAEDEEFQARFAREAQNIARLKHPNIVQVYDFDYDSLTNRYYMVMELVQGVTLKDYLVALKANGRSLPLKDILRITREAASALAYAHDAGMLHRDVKPANLMINQEDSHVVLTDFGIARLVDSKQLTASGGIAGTPAYLSPEQGVGEAGDGRSDIYALGIILFQMLTGELPYNAENALSVLMMHVNDPIPNVNKYNPQVPSSVKAIVERAMEKDPKERYQTAHQLIEDIRLAERGFILATRSTTTAPTLSQPVITIPKTQSTLETSRISLATHPRMQPVKKEREIPIALWVSIISVLVILLAGVTFRQPLLDLYGMLGKNTLSGAIPTMTQTMTLAPTATASVIPSATPSDVPTFTLTPSVTPSLTLTLTPTFSPTSSPMPTLTPNPTATPVVLASPVEDCTYDYAIISQEPQDGNAGGYFTINTRYTRAITLLNVGTCEWGMNASLTFIRGEDFNAGPRIFLRESVGVGDEVTLIFEGTTPSKGAFDPLLGTWELRTRLQQIIGQPFIIAVQVYDPGPRN